MHFSVLMYVCFRSPNLNFAPERSFYWDRSYSPDNALSEVMSRMALFEHLQQQDSTSGDDGDVENSVVEFCGEAATYPARG